MNVLQTKNANKIRALVIERHFVKPASPMDYNETRENGYSPSEPFGAIGGDQNGGPRKRSKRRNSRWSDEYSSGDCDYSRRQNMVQEVENGREEKTNWNRMERREWEEQRSRRWDERREREERRRRHGRREKDSRSPERDRSSDRRAKQADRASSHSEATPTGSKPTRNRAKRRQRQREKAAGFASYSVSENQKNGGSSSSNNSSADRPPIWLPQFEPGDAPEPPQPPIDNDSQGVDVANIVHNLDQLWPSWSTLALGLGLANLQLGPPMQSPPNNPDYPQLRSPTSRFQELERRRREPGRVLPSAAMFTNCDTVLGSSIVRAPNPVDRPGKPAPPQAKASSSPLADDEARVETPSPPPPPPPPPPLPPIHEEPREEEPPGEREEESPAGEREETPSPSPKSASPAAAQPPSWLERAMQAAAEPRGDPPRPAEQREEPPWPAVSKLEDPNAIPLIEPVQLIDPRTAPTMVERADVRPMSLRLPRFAKKLKQDWEKGPFEWGPAERPDYVWPEELMMQQAHRDNNDHITGNSQTESNLQASLSSDVRQQALNADVIQKALNSPIVRQALESPTIKQALKPKHKPPPLSIDPCLIQQALSSPTIQRALNSPTLQQALNSDVVQPLNLPTTPQQTPHFNNISTTPPALNLEMMQQALNTPAVNNSVTSPALQQALNLHSVHQALNLSVIQQALNSPTVQQALNSPTLQQALNFQSMSQSQNVNPFPAEFSSTLQSRSQATVAPEPQYLTSPQIEYASPFMEADQWSPEPMELCTPPQDPETSLSVPTVPTTVQKFVKKGENDDLSAVEQMILADLKHKNRELRKLLRQALAISKNGHLLINSGLSLDGSDDET